MKFKPATLMSIFSLSISLFILGLYVLVLVHISNISKIINEKTPFVVELKDGIPEAEVEKLVDSLGRKSEIINIQLIYKEAGLAKMKEQLGANILEVGEENPLKDVLTLNLKSKFIEEGKVDTLKSQLLANDYITNCIFEKESVDNLKANLESLNSLFLILGLIFIVISFVLIYNNIKLILHGDRFVIKTLELIGGSPSFIKRPYIKISLSIGFLAGIISVLLLSVLLIYLHINYGIFDSIAHKGISILVILSTFIVSITLPPILANYQAKKYLLISDKIRYK